jgi:biotin synthase-related radical SAM superfamily protein
MERTVPALEHQKTELPRLTNSQILKAGNCLGQKNADYIRVSTGTAVVLGLLESKLDAEPTTAYLMTYREGKCSANCSFCPQARESSSKTELLSRVTWPTFPTEKVIDAIDSAFRGGKIMRVCIQALNYSDVFADLQLLVKGIKQRCPVAVSVSCQPFNKENITLLRDAGVDRLGIALDGATEAIVNRVKGGCISYAHQFELFSEALSVFGKGNVSTHVIVGLGETEKEAVETIQRCVDLGVLPALFAFTPIRGTALEHNSPPKLASYRRVQLARHLIVTGKARFSGMSFNLAGEVTGYGVTAEVLAELTDSGVAFRTSGCPDCNRPYYNEKPSGPIYNYPKKLDANQIKKIKTELSYKKA